MDSCCLQRQSDLRSGVLTWRGTDNRARPSPWCLRMIGLVCELSVKPRTSIEADQRNIAHTRIP